MWRWIHTVVHSWVVSTRGRREMERVVSVPCRKMETMNREPSDIWWPWVCWGWRVGEGQGVCTKGGWVCDKKHYTCVCGAYTAYTRVSPVGSHVWGCNQIVDRMSITGARHVMEVPLWQREGWLWPSAATAQQGSTIKARFCIFQTLSLLSYNRPHSSAFTAWWILPSESIGSCRKRKKHEQTEPF